MSKTTITTTEFKVAEFKTAEICCCCGEAMVVEEGIKPFCEAKGCEMAEALFSAFGF